MAGAGAVWPGAAAEPISLGLVFGPLPGGAIAVTTSASLREYGMAGLVGGALVLVGLVVGAAVTGEPYWAPLRWSAALLGSEPALIMAGQARGGLSLPAVVVFGALIHFGVAIALAWVFFRIEPSVRTSSKLAIAGCGMAYGLGAWALMNWIFLPFFDFVMAERLALMPGVFLGAALGYGAVLGLFAARRAC